MYSILKIDELLLSDHPFLTPNDECYYFMEYRTGIWDKVGSIIRNFKKSPAQKSEPHYRYKIIEIKNMASIFRQAIPITNDTILVPIPPSKRRDHPEYDDRVLRMLKIFCGQDANADIRDIFSAKHNLLSSHASPIRPTPAQLSANLELNLLLCVDKKPNIILIDDVITAGTHFTACKSLLQEQFPHSNITGVFIARRVPS